MPLKKPTSIFVGFFSDDLFPFTVYQRAAVSKTACRGFDPFCPCQRKVRKHAVYGLFAFFENAPKSGFDNYLTTKVIPIYFGL